MLLRPSNAAFHATQSLEVPLIMVCTGTGLAPFRGFVQLWGDGADIVELVKQGATVYVGGDGKHMAPQVRDTCGRIHQEVTGVSEADAEAWMNEVDRIPGRYAADIFT